MILTIDIDEKQIARLNFIIKTFNPNDDLLNMNNLNVSVCKAIEDSIDTYYKEVLGNINQGNEHDGLPFVNEII